MFNDTFLNSFNERFKKFREMESQIIEGQSNENGSPKAFALLSNMELCYASKAYYACIILAFAAIEASINHELGNAGNMKQKLIRSGYSEEADWLRELRNSFVHRDEGNVKYILRGQNEEEMEEYCQKALKLVHQIFFNPIKTNA